jgi:hypothetical protein
MMKNNMIARIMVFLSQNGFFNFWSTYYFDLVSSDFPTRSSKSVSSAAVLVLFCSSAIYFPVLGFCPGISNGSVVESILL